MAYGILSSMSPFSPFLPILHLPLRRHQQRDFFVFIPVEATVGNVDAAQRIEQGFERLAADG